VKVVSPCPHYECECWCARRSARLREGARGARRDCVRWTLGKGFVRGLLVRAVTAVFVCS